MNANIKIGIAVVVVVAAISGIYISKSHNATPTVLAPQNNVNTEVATSTVTPSDNISNTPTIAQNTPTTKTTPKPTSTLYKGEFFPFSVSIPQSLIQAKNPAQSTSALETRTYSFNRLALDGGISGYISIYAKPSDGNKYDELVTLYPEKYSEVKLGNNDFYKLVEKIDTTNKGYKVEYITFQKNVQYRFVLNIANGDKTDIEISKYNNEFKVLEDIALSLKVN
jgi:hypothetical protein